jgi:tetrahydromethanopterin S-methyltransferase subunit G
MQTMVRESWTDERLDDLKAKVDEGFKKVDQRFEKVDQRFDRLEARVFTREEAEQRFQVVDRRFEEVNQRLDRVDARFESMQGMMERRFDTLQYSILYSVLGIFAAVMAGFVALILAG